MCLNNRKNNSFTRFVFFVFPRSAPRLPRLLFSGYTTIKQHYNRVSIIKQINLLAALFCCVLLAQTHLITNVNVNTNTCLSTFNRAKPFNPYSDVRPIMCVHILCTRPHIYFRWRYFFDYAEDTVDACPKCIKQLRCRNEWIYPVRCNGILWYVHYSASIRCRRCILAFDRCNRAP